MTHYIHYDTILFYFFFQSLSLHPYVTTTFIVVFKYYGSNDRVLLKTYSAHNIYESFLPQWQPDLLNQSLYCHPSMNYIIINTATIITTLTTTGIVVICIIHNLFIIELLLHIFIHILDFNHNQLNHSSTPTIIYKPTQ